MAAATRNEWMLSSQYRTTKNLQLLILTQKHIYNTFFASIDKYVHEIYVILSKKMKSDPPTPSFSLQFLFNMPTVLRIYDTHFGYFKKEIFRRQKNFSRQKSNITFWRILLCIKAVPLQLFHY